MLLVLYNSCLKAGPYDDAKPCVASMYCIVNMICFLQCNTNENRSIIPSAVLYFTNEFSILSQCNRCIVRLLYHYVNPALKTEVLWRGLAH